MHKHLAAILTSGFLLIGGPAFAHHAFSADYDVNKPAQLEGKVTKVDWGNPHSYLTIEGRADNGKHEHFKVELGSRRALEKNGWKHKSVRVGDEVTVIGWYGRHDGDHVNAKAVRLNHSGRELDAASSYFSTAAAN